ncbi:MAG TPA: FAD-dependent oxidoreductase [Phycisphaerae bacterium]|nr:FAD-dependent oxidoreductase [Phycisphaerae bacterium]HRW53074.1 FAD-dependent oxidoreductase [Phycisphaerae bacterium]
MQDKRDRRTIVIVGGVAGGASAATRARRCNEDAHIIMYEKDKHVSFANCGLPYYVGDEIRERSKLLVATPELFEKRFNIEVHTEHEVVSVHRDAKVVSVKRLSTGETFDQPYDRLILAPGATPIRPPMEGVDRPNVFTLRNLVDADRIRSFVRERKPERVAVVGAGFIGLEMVEQLKRIGVQTSLIELTPQVLPPLDAEMAHIIEAELIAEGIELHLGDGVAGFEQDCGLVTGVALSSGAVIEADMVILGIGVRPATQLAAEAGLELGQMGGITVNAHMQTSDPWIYAVGDAVEYQYGPTETPARIALAGPANRAGRIAGQHAAIDEADEMAPVYGTSIVRVFGKAAAVTGLSMKLARRFGRDARSVFVVGRHHAGYFPGGRELILKLIYDPKTEKVLGAQAVGPEGADKRIDIVATLMRFGGTVRDLAGLDLAYAPPYGSAKDVLHMAAFAACNDLDDVTPAAPIDASLDGKQVIDVRTKQELIGGSIPGAKHIPVDELRDRLGELDAAKPTVTVCRSGQRGHIAARILRGHGFADVEDLTGGMLMRHHAFPENGKA